MINESAKRKATFDEVNSVRVVLADGQAWAIAKPWLELRPGFRDGRSAAAYPVFTYGPEIGELVELITMAQGFIQQISVLATLAAKLLLYQYELADEDLDQLLAYRKSDPTSIAWGQSVLEVAIGRSGPKVSSAGDD
jgi:hypothetical protein